MLLVLGTISLLIATVFRLLVGGILLVAGAGKLWAGSKRFQEDILGYELVSDRIAWLLARALPWAEVLAGVLLVVGLLSQLSAILATILLLVFSTAIALNLVRGRSHACGCMHKSSGVIPIQWKLIYRNVTLMGMLICVYVFDGGTFSLDSYFALSTTSVSGPIGLLLLCATWMFTVAETFVLQRATKRQTAKRMPAEVRSKGALR